MRRRIKVGLVTLDMRLAAEIKKVLQDYRVEVVHSADADSLPLDVDVVITSGKEGLAAPGRKVVYCDDFQSLEDCVERALELAIGGPGHRMAVVAIDPGKNLGAAYLLDSFILRTRRYGSVEDLARDIEVFLRRHKEVERKYVIVGAASSPAAVKPIMRALEKAISGLGATIVVYDESFTAKAPVPQVSGMSKDEYSALVLSLRSILALGR